MDNKRNLMLSAAFCLSLSSPFVAGDQQKRQIGPDDQGQSGERASKVNRGIAGSAPGKREVSEILCVRYIKGRD